MHNVLVHMPTDGQYEYGLFRSYGQAVQLLPDEGSYTLYPMAFKNIVGARNLAAKEVLNQNFSHLLFLDSDMEFIPATLARLLQHNVDIVGGVYCRKLRPHTPLVFKKHESGKGLMWFMPPRKLVECEAIATGCLLISRKVFETMPQPYFNYEQSDVDPLQTTTEDITFCKEAKKAGFKIYCDGSLWAGHIGKVVIWPNSAGDSRVETYGGTS